MANFAFVENSEILGVYDFLPVNWRNISNFNLINDWERLNSLGWYKLEKILPYHDPETQKLDRPRHYFSEGVAYETYEVKNLPPKPSIPEPSIWDEIIQERDQRIQEVELRIQNYESEIQQGLEPSEDIEALMQYLEELNMITDQDPNNIIWPEYNAE
jgi:hypothetical protein